MFYQHKLWLMCSARQYVPDYLLYVTIKQICRSLIKICSKIYNVGFLFRE